LSLGDKCKTCAILLVCGTCHDDANDPGFRFRVDAKVEEQKHGTIEAGTGEPKQPGAASGERAPAKGAGASVAREPLAVVGALERSFRLSGPKD